MLASRPMTAAKAPFTTRTVAPPGSTAVASDIFVAESKGTNLLSFGRSEAAALRGGGADGRVHGILPAIRTGQGGQSQNVRFVKAGHGVDGGHLQFVARQRACLIRAQHVDACRFIHGGEPRGKDAQMRQSPRAERRRKGKGSRQRYRDRRQNRREHQGNDLTPAAS